MSDIFENYNWATKTSTKLQRANRPALGAGQLLSQAKVRKQSYRMICAGVKPHTLRHQSPRQRRSTSTPRS